MPDQYLIYTPADLDELAHAVVTKEAFTFPYSDDQASCYIISIAKAPKLGGVMPWGGQIEGMHLVALRLRGSNFFDLYSDMELHPGYLMEKLSLEDGAAKSIAKLLNGIRERIVRGTA